MADLNKCIFTGRIGNDIELKSTSSGVSTCSFRLAVERPKAKSAQEAETDWLDVVAWRSTAEFCSRYLSKGRKVVVECAVRTRKWNDRDGKPAQSRRIPHREHLPRRQQTKPEHQRPGAIRSATVAGGRLR